MQEITADLSMNTAAHGAHTELGSKYFVETVFRFFFFSSTFVKRVDAIVIYVFRCQLVCQSLYNHKLPIELHKELYV